MAKVSGAAAYQQLRKPEDGLSESFQYWGGLYARRNDAATARREAEKAEKKKKFEDDYGINDDDYFLEDTEFRTVNDASLEAMSLYRDKHYELYNKLKEDPNNMELKKEFGKVNNSVKNLKMSHEKFLTIGEDYLAKLDAGTISGVDEDVWKERLEAYDEGRIKVKLDEGGNAAYLFYNKDGELEDTISYKELIQGSLVEKVDIPAQVTSFVGQLGKKEYDEASGGFVTSYNEWGEKQQSVTDAYIDSFMSNDDVVADILNQIDPTSTKRDNFTEEDKAEVKEYLNMLVKGAYDTKVTKKPFNRPQGRSLSFGDKQKMKTANNLFDISMRASSGEKAALGQMIGSRIKVQDGERTMEKVIDSYAVTDEGTIFLDNAGNEIANIPNDNNKRRRALQFAMIIENGQSADNVQSTFELGEGLAGGTFNTGDFADISVRSEVADIDTTPVENLPRDEEDAVRVLKDQYKELGFKFKSPINIFSEKIKITAPDGTVQSFKTKEKSAIKNFLEEHSPTKTVFQSGNATSGDDIFKN